MLRRGGTKKIRANFLVPPLLNTISQGGGGGGVHRKKNKTTISQLRALATHTRSLGRSVKARGS